jgi:predicted HTH transcriptional regulator
MKSKNSPHPAQDKGKLKNNTASTSMASFKALNASVQREREWQKVLAALAIHQPATSRMLTTIMSIERTNITRSLNDLVAAKKIKVTFEAPCKTTGKSVNHHTINLATLISKQTKLF